ncbi:MAG: hypothetical protein WCD38_11725 [Candidatus Tumulicola sp.]
MPEPIRIRAKTGEIVDLAYERALHEALERDMPESPSLRANGALLDALEAACNVPEYAADVRGELHYALGANDMRRMIRKAAGVVEERA